MSVEFQRDPFLSLMQKFLQSDLPPENKIKQLQKQMLIVDQDYQQANTLVSKSYQLSSSKLIRHIGCNSRNDRHILLVSSQGFSLNSPCLENNFIDDLTTILAAQVWQIKPRLAPESQYPSAAMDIMSAYNMMRIFGIGEEQIIIVATGCGAQLVQDWLQLTVNQGAQLNAGIALLFPWFNDHCKASKLNIYQQVWQQLAENYGAKQKLEYFNWPIKKAVMVDCEHNLDSIELVKQQLLAKEIDFSSRSLLISHAYLYHHWRHKNIQAIDFIKEKLLS